MYFDHNAEQGIPLAKPNSLRFEGTVPRAAEIKESTQHGTKYNRRFADDKEKSGAVIAEPEIPSQGKISQTDRTEGRPLNGRPSAPLPDCDNPQIHRHDDAPIYSERDAQHGTQYYRKFIDGEGKSDTNAANTTVNHEKRHTHAVSGTQVDSSASDARPQTGMPQGSSRLQFSPEERAPDKSRPDAVQQPVEPRSPGKPDKKVSRARNQMERADKKLDAAREKLPTKRSPRLERVPDPDTGKTKRRLAFEKETKSQRDHIRGSLAVRPLKAGANAAIGYVHRKIYETDHENVGIEAAHKGELAVEGAARQVAYSNKTRPYRRVSKLQRKASKARFKLSWRETLRDDLPDGLRSDLKKKTLARMAHKRSIKKQYANAARNTKSAVHIASSAGKAASQAVKAVAAAVKSHPAVAVTIIALGMILIIMVSAFSSCSNMAMGGMSAMLSASYLAEDADINAAELVYTGFENELREEIENVENDYPDYDEYNYELDAIGHNPRELISFLTAVYRDFQYADVYDVLREVFEEQYTLEFEAEVEVRYADPNDSDDDGDTEPYDYYILNISLTAKPFSEVIAQRLEEAQRKIHELLLESGGNRQYTMSPFAFDWRPYISSYFGYRANPFTGESEFHTGIDIAVATGTPILAAHDGIVTSVIYGTTGYGYQVMVTGENGISTRYAHCNSILVSVGQEVTAGDAIARVQRLKRYCRGLQSAFVL